MERCRYSPGILNIGVLMFAVIASNTLCSAFGNRKEQLTPLSQKPNIIYILADDLSYRDLSCFGQTQYQTPNLDALSSSGVRFTQAYAGAPESAPSRGALMTGMHIGHGPIRANSSARGPEFIPDTLVTVAEALKTAGYATCFVGKWGMGLPGSEGVPEKQGFDYSFGFYDQTLAHTYFPFDLMENGEKIEYPGNYQFDMARLYKMNSSREPIMLNKYDKDGKLILHEMRDQSKAVYSQDEIDKAAFSFLKKNESTPFFLYYATQLPHGPIIVDDLGAMKDVEGLPQRQKEWGAMVRRLDCFVGKLVLYLRESGQYDNTIIFFSSDNGYSMCGYMGRGNAPDWEDDPYLNNKGPFRGGKFSVLEGGLRVPFFISWPKYFKPGVVSKPVWLIDFYATATDLAGVVNTQRTDGNSLLPLLLRQAAPGFENRPMYFAKNREQAVRMGAWAAYRVSPQNEIELYLIEDDIHSDRNLAAIYPDVVKQMEIIMEKEHESSEWYRNPWESDSQFQQKREKARSTGNIFPTFRPNGLK